MDSNTSAKRRTSHVQSEPATRPRCQYCRLAKCKQAGMKTDYINRGRGNASQKKSPKIEKMVIGMGENKIKNEDFFNKILFFVLEFIMEKFRTFFRNKLSNNC